jgi:hypothetical protein
VSTVHWWLNFFLERPVFDSEQMESLHGLIVDVLPQWSSKLCALANEDARKCRVLGRAGELFEAIHEWQPPRRFAVLKGAYPGLSMYLTTSDSTCPPELNMISIEIERVDEADDAAAWAARLFDEAVRRLPVRYANGYADEEFHAKNMVTTDGWYGIGVKLDYAIPGIYWLNYYGSDHVRLIGQSRLLSAPSYRISDISSGVFIAMSATPTEWNSEAYKAREFAVIQHVGSQYYFSRHEPQRKTIAPKFTRWEKV